MVQIAFLTLFLGLTSGRQDIAVAVRGPAAAVELMLDGAAVVRVGGPPWKAKVDLGSALAPHELVARALDAQGHEVARTRQMLNMPRPAAEVEILLDGGAKGTQTAPSGAHLAWRSLDGVKPAAMSLVLDGKPVALDAEGHAALPPLDAAVSHVLTAEVRFSDSIAARKDVAFGGALGEEVSTDLTAVAVRLRPKTKLPDAKDLQGWFAAGGKPLSVTAVDQGRAEVLMVVDGEAHKRIEHMQHMRGNVGSTDAAPAELDRFQIKPGKNYEMRFIWPSARQATGAGLTSDLFDASRAYTPQEGSLLYYLLRARPLREDAARMQRLADATAVAGLQALAANCPRAVLVVLGEQPKDSSRYDAETVRRYLESIRVPLVVWSLKGPKSPAAGWGEVEDVSTYPKLQSALERLEDNLQAQRIVWVEGGHVPAAVTLSPAAAEVLEPAR
jgi:hypothetical protein